MEDLALSYYLRQAACASAPACQSPQWRLQQRPPWYPRHAGGPCLSLLYPRASSRLLVLLWEGKSILFSLLFLCSHVQLCCNVSQRNKRGNDSLTKQMSEKHLCPQDNLAEEEGVQQAVTWDRSFLLAGYVSSHQQGLIQFFKVGKRLQAFPIRSVATVADFRTRSLGSSSGYVAIILWLST